MMKGRGSGALGARGGVAVGLDFGAVFGLGKFLLFHQDGDELGQGVNFLVLHADDRQQLEDDQEEEDRDADE